MKKGEKIKQASGGLAALAIIIAFFLWWHYSTKIDDYSFCVEACVSDNDYCVSSSIAFDKSSNGWISEYNYQNCFNELDLCVMDCEG